MASGYQGLPSTHRPLLHQTSRISLPYPKKSPLRRCYYYCIPTYTYTLYLATLVTEYLIPLPANAPHLRKPPPPRASPYHRSSPSHVATSFSCMHPLIYVCPPDCRRASRPARAKWREAINRYETFPPPQPPITSGRGVYPERYLDRGLIFNHNKTALVQVADSHLWTSAIYLSRIFQRPVSIRGGDICLSLLRANPP